MNIAFYEKNQLNKMSIEVEEKMSGLKHKKVEKNSLEFVKIRRRLIKITKPFTLK